jgi:hypothetical protein
MLRLILPCLCRPCHQCRPERPMLRLILLRLYRPFRLCRPAHPMLRERPFRR